jgi:hypothetical protein
MCNKHVHVLRFLVRSLELGGRPPRAAPKANLGIAPHTSRGARRRSAAHHERRWRHARARQLPNLHARPGRARRSGRSQAELPASSVAVDPWLARVAHAARDALGRRARGHRDHAQVRRRDAHPAPRGRPHRDPPAGRPRRGRHRLPRLSCQPASGRAAAQADRRSSPQVALYPHCATVAAAAATTVAATLPPSTAIATPRPSGDAALPSHPPTPPAAATALALAAATVGQPAPAASSQPPAGPLSSATHAAARACAVACRSTAGARARLE